MASEAHNCDALRLSREGQTPVMEPGGDGRPSKKSECDAATFKVPYPYKNPATRLPLQPTARRLATLYQPWTQTQTLSSAGRTSGPGLPQHPWAGWAGFHQLYGGPDPSQRHGPLAGHTRDFFAGALQQGAPLRYPLKLIPVTVLPEDAERPAAGYRMEAPPLREGSASGGLSGRPAPAGDRGCPWGRRSDRQPPHSCSGPTSLSPSFLIPSLPPVEDVKPNEELLYGHLVGRGDKHLTAPRLVSSSSSSSCGHNSQQEGMSFQTERKPIFESSSPPASPSSSPAPSPEPFPWLLPHFAAGSLIELRDGRLKRVEDLETEDFLLGSAARRGLQLSCCTVQSITSSSSPSSSCPASLSRLLILLHNQNSQELVDVYVEYPFFVRGRGWSSCCPERTARLCGLTCGQLSVGDVCLALIPASPGGAAPLPGEAAARRCTAKEQDRNRGPAPGAQGHDAQQGPAAGE